MISVTFISIEQLLHERNYTDESAYGGEDEIVSFECNSQKTFNAVVYKSILSVAGREK